MEGNISYIVWSLRSWDKKRPLNQTQGRHRDRAIRGGSEFPARFFVVFFRRSSFFTHQVPQFGTGETASTNCNSNGLWLVYYLLPMSSCIKKQPNEKSVSGILYSTFSDGLGAEKHTHFSNNKSFSFAYSIMQSYKKCEKVSCLICSASFAYPTTKRRAETIGKMLLGEHGNPQGFVWNVQSYMSAIWPELQEVHTK